MYMKFILIVIEDAYLRIIGLNTPCKISSSNFYGMVVRKLGFVSTTTWHDEKLGKIVWDYYAEMENILEALYCTQRTYWT